MKHTSFFIGSIILLLSHAAFSQVPKKIVVEHFTNTNCGTCAVRNPGFYTNLNNQSGVLHLAVHPSSPYSSCLLYQQNATANDARTNYYGIYGSTPRLVINGNVILSSANYASSSIFTPYQSLTSPASIRIVQEKFGVDSIRATVIIKTETAHSLSNLSLFVALAEDTVFYTGTNGEPMHFDVFRKSLSNITGTSVTLPTAIGDSVVFTFSSPANSIWNFSRIFTLAILQETSSKNLVQAEASSVSGEIIATGISETPTSLKVIIFPNPVSGKLQITGYAFEQKTNYAIITTIGQTISEGEMVKSEIDVSELAKGLYYFKLGNTVKKFLKL